jgi:HK97 gp10 family phage protein
MPSSVTIEGADDLLRKLAELTKVAQGEVVQRAVMDGAYIVEREAKRIVPVDTGNLKNSIRSELDEIEATRVTAVTGTNVEYAPYVELGTGRQRPKPYLRPALDTQQGLIERAVGAALEREINRIAGSS